MNISTYSVHDKTGIIASTATIIADMVAEFGISKTHNTIQALFDADKLTQEQAGTLLDVLKADHCTRKQAARMIGLL